MQEKDELGDIVEERLNELEEDRHILEKRLDIQQSYLDKRKKEIQLVKAKIEELIDLERESKRQVVQNIEMLEWFIESFDDSIDELKNSMIERIDEAIIESSKDLEKVIEDLKEIIEPLKISKSMKDEDVEELIFSITSTLELFVENIEEMIYPVGDSVQSAIKRAVEASGEEFVNFFEDIHQVFTTFNSILQKLKLTNSIAKYIELEDIYNECDRIINEINSIRLKIAVINAEKDKMDIDTRLREKFGNSLTKDVLREKKLFLEKLLKEKEDKLERIDNSAEDLRSELEVIELDNENLQSFFNALSDEIEENQKTATETYNLMYSTLENIYSTLPSIKRDLMDTSNASSSQIIADFTKAIKAFAKIINIIKKIRNIPDIEKKKSYLKKVKTNAQSHIKKLGVIRRKMAKDVKNANIKAIDASFDEFNQFISLFKDKFYIIKENVSAITLSTSKGLIHNLQEILDDRLNKKDDLGKILQEKKAYETICDYIRLRLNEVSLQMESIDEEKKRSRRVLIYRRKSVFEDDGLSELVNWTVESASVEPVNNVVLNDFIDGEIEVPDDLDGNFEYVLDKDRNIIVFKIGRLAKRDKISINYRVIHAKSVENLPENLPDLAGNIYMRPKYRYSAIAKGVSLQIIEKDGKGAIILKNESLQHRLKNLMLVFDPKTDSTDLGAIKIPSLEPLQSFIKKYNYKSEKSLKPALFYAECPLELYYRLKRSEKKDEYIIETAISNNSDFLMTVIEISAVLFKENGDYEILFTHNKIKPIRPMMDDVIEQKIITEQDPPSIALKIHYSVPLIIEDTVSDVDIDHLKETPHLLGREYTGPGLSGKGFKTRDTISAGDAISGSRKVTPKMGMDEGYITIEDESVLLDYLDEDQRNLVKKSGKRLAEILEDFSEMSDIRRLNGEINSINTRISELELELENLKKTLIQKQKQRARLAVNYFGLAMEEQELMEKADQILAKKEDELEIVEDLKKEFGKMEKELKKVGKRGVKKSQGFSVAKSSIKKDNAEIPAKAGGKGSSAVKAGRKKAPSVTSSAVSKAGKTDPNKVEIPPFPEIDKGGLIQVKNIANATVAGILIKSRAHDFVSAIERKYKRLKRIHPDFDALYRHRTLFTDRKMLFVNIPVAKQINTLIKNEATDLKNYIAIRYFKVRSPQKLTGGSKAKPKSADRSGHSNVSSGPGTDKKGQKAAEKGGKPLKDEKNGKSKNINTSENSDSPGANGDSTFAEVKALKDADKVILKIGSRGSELMRLIEKKNARLKRKSLGFQELFRIRRNFEKSGTTEISVPVARELLKILSGEGKSLSGSIELRFYKRISLDKSHIDEFLSL